MKINPSVRDEITNEELRLILNEVKIFEPQDTKSCKME